MLLRTTKAKDRWARWAFWIEEKEKCQSLGFHQEFIFAKISFIRRLGAQKLSYEYPNLEVLDNPPLSDCVCLPKIQRSREF